MAEFVFPTLSVAVTVTVVVPSAVIASVVVPEPDAVVAPLIVQL